MLTPSTPKTFRPRPRIEAMAAQEGATAGVGLASQWSLHRIEATAAQKAAAAGVVSASLRSLQRIDAMAAL
jgi:hypothetical protein